MSTYYHWTQVPAAQQIAASQWGSAEPRAPSCLTKRYQICFWLLIDRSPLDDTHTHQQLANAILSHKTRRGPARSDHHIVVREDKKRPNLCSSCYTASVLQTEVVTETGRTYTTKRRERERERERASHLLPSSPVVVEIRERQCCKARVWAQNPGRSSGFPPLNDRTETLAAGELGQSSRSVRTYARTPWSDRSRSPWEKWSVLFRVLVTASSSWRLRQKSLSQT